MTSSFQVETQFISKFRRESDLYEEEACRHEVSINIQDLFILGLPIFVFTEWYFLIHVIVFNESFDCVNRKICVIYVIYKDSGGLHEDIVRQQIKYA